MGSGYMNSSGAAFTEATNYAMSCVLDGVTAPCEKDKGPWDYKYRDPAVNEGKRSRYEPFGNFNYGASGAAAGFSEGQLLRLAGHYQTDRTYAQGENPGMLRSILGIGGRAPYGDEAGDQDQIRNGIDYYRRKFVLKDCQ